MQVYFSELKACVSPNHHSMQSKLYRAGFKFRFSLTATNLNPENLGCTNCVFIIT